MSEMLNAESFERVSEGLHSAASCCREMAALTSINAWIDLSNQFLIMRKKAKTMYESAPLNEVQIQAMVLEMEVAQKASAMMREMNG